MLVYEDKRCIYQGKWVNDEFREGRIVQKDGSLMEGVWQNQKMYGEGRQMMNGEDYRGFFNSGNRHGEGLLNKADGTSFVVMYNMNTIVREH